MEYVEVARAETRRGELVLRERRPRGAPSSLELRANGVFVMDTVEVATEQALATAALGLVADPADVLVGGLGLGFTMHQVLADLRVRTCTVVEVEEPLVDWMREGTIPHGPAMLADARIEVVVADIAAVVAQTPPQSYDLVLLDVDNGPGYLVHDANAALYEKPFLAAVRAALRPGGAVVIWSADEAPVLEGVLAATFEESRAVPHDVRLQQRDERYWLYVGLRRGRPSLGSPT